MKKIYGHTPDQINKFFDTIRKDGCMSCSYEIKTKCLKACNCQKRKIKTIKRV